MVCLSDMNNDGVTTYKDFFVRVLSPAGYVLLGVLNLILDSDLGKFFEVSAIEETYKALACLAFSSTLLLYPPS